MAQAEAGRLPRPHNEKDAEKLLALAEKANEAAKDKAEIDADIVRKVAFTAAGELSPMAATLGGIVGQEVRGLPPPAINLLQSLFSADVAESSAAPCLLHQCALRQDLAY